MFFIVWIFKKYRKYYNHHFLNVTWPISVCCDLGPAGIVGGACTELSLPSIPRRGALEQDTKPPTAPREPQHKWLPTAPGCVHCCVCTLDGLNAEHKFRAWVTILRCMSHHFLSFFYFTVMHKSSPMASWDSKVTTKFTSEVVGHAGTFYIQFFDTMNSEHHFLFVYCFSHTI